MVKHDKYKKKTLSSYWNNFNLREKKMNILFLKIKHVLKNFYHYIGFKISLKIIKLNNRVDEQFTSYQTDKYILQLRDNKLSEVIASYLKKFHININRGEVFSLINEFQDVFFKSPIRELSSGFGFNEGLIFYCLLKKINPLEVVESGVMRGFTTYLIDKATSNNCKIYCFDINFDNLEYISEKASYHNHDISIKPPKITSSRTIAFWDDHTNHLDRLKFSIKNKIRYNIFDDDLSFLNFHSDGWPPLPSITMLKELKTKSINSKEIKWICRNKTGKLWVHLFSDYKILRDIKCHELFPDLFSITGYKRHSQSSFLILKNLISK